MPWGGVEQKGVGQGKNWEGKGLSFREELFLPFCHRSLLHKIHTDQGISGEGVGAAPGILQETQAVSRFLMKFIPYPLH